MAAHAAPAHLERLTHIHTVPQVQQPWIIVSSTAKNLVDV